MGFVRTEQELAAYYALGVRQFKGALMMGVMFQTRPEIVERLLPPPLQPAPMPSGLIFIAQYPKTNLGPGYREAALYLGCQYRGEQGTYCLSMPIDSEPNRMHNGRDIFGLPKKAASIHLEREGNRVRGWVERMGIRFVEITLDLSGSLPEVPPTGPSFTFKAMPRIDLKPGFDGPVFLCRQRTIVEMKRFEIGMPEVVLTPSWADPWADVEIVQTLIGFYMESDNTMQPGDVLAEVSPEAFLPHYFKMTDFPMGTTEGEEND
jgi:acetoacetate decarboxylase